MEVKHIMCDEAATLRFRPVLVQIVERVEIVPGILVVGRRRARCLCTATCACREQLHSCEKNANSRSNAVCESLRQQQTAFLAVNLALARTSGVALRTEIQIT